jgi:hypothetical protein
VVFSFEQYANSQSFFSPSCHPLNFLSENALKICILKIAKNTFATIPARKSAVEKIALFCEGAPDGPKKGFTVNKSL